MSARGTALPTIVPHQAEIDFDRVHVPDLARGRDAHAEFGLEVRVHGSDVATYPATLRPAVDAD